MICEYACRKSHSDRFRAGRVALVPVQHRSDYMNDYPNSHISWSLMNICTLQVVLFSIFNFVFHILNFHNNSSTKQCHTKVVFKIILVLYDTKYIHPRCLAYWSSWNLQVYFQNYIYYSRQTFQRILFLFFVVLDNF